MANTRDLSILIPARNEIFLTRTVQDLLTNIEGDTEIIVVLDGEWADPPLPTNERLTVIYNPSSVGQRAATNQACRLSRAKYVMKTDAHCAFEKGFDVKMMAAMHDDWTMAPLMKNLHAFDWVCSEGHRRYQGPSGPCLTCGKETQRDVVWIAKDSPKSISYCFDSTLHFQYFGEYSKRSEAQVNPSESMSLQGSFFMLTREKYWELNVCDEDFGSWGQQGVEVACKTWLSGGKVMVNKNTWYAHMFRTQGGDFGFPYPLSGRQVEKARQYSRELFLNNKWEKQIRPLSWLIDKFRPVPGWHDSAGEKVLKEIRQKGKSFNKQETSQISVSEPSVKESVSVPVPAVSVSTELTKGIIFYTDNQLPLKIAHKVQKTLKKISLDKHIPIVCSSLKKMDFGDKNIHFPSLKRGYLTMAKQILAALEHSCAEWIYFCEHDVLYSSSHFDFVPPKKDRFYYNQNFWKLRLTDGHAIHFDASQLSGMVAHRELLLTEYRKVVDFIEKNGFSYRMVSFEPGTRDGRAEVWKSDVPLVDVRHGGNLTKDRWSKDDFRDQSTCLGWLESDNEIFGWGKNIDLIKSFV